MHSHAKSRGLKSVRVLGCAAALFAAPAAAQTMPQWQAMITEASLRFGIPVVWIERVMRAESGGRTTLDGRPIVSRAGAMGLMQLMPGTWDEMRRIHGLGKDPHDPRDNILAGTAYLRAMYDRFGYPGMFAAYNAGPARYASHLATGRPLPAETRAYLAAVSTRGAEEARTAMKDAAPTLFYRLRSAERAADRAVPVESEADIFITLSRTSTPPTP
jgi:soluble lytic murein transglycosylase-like protein